MENYEIYKQGCWIPETPTKRGLAQHTVDVGSRSLVKQMMENNEISKQGLWTPETPTKRGFTQHKMDIGGGSPAKQIKLSYNNVLESGLMASPHIDSKSLDEVSTVNAVNNPSSNFPRGNGVEFYPPLSSKESNGQKEVNDERYAGYGVELYPPLSSKERRNDQREVNDEPRGGYGVEFCPPLSSQESSNHMKVDDEPQKRTKKKVYRPKVISQLPKREKKSQPKSSDSTPNPSTPKQKRSYVRKEPKCQRSIFFEEDSFSLPFLTNINESKVEQDGIENSAFKNESGIEYNSLQSYQKLRSDLCSLLVDIRRDGRNCPLTCKKKRLKRQRQRLEKFLPLFTKGERSKSFVRKRKSWIAFRIEGKSRISRKFRLTIKKIQALKKRINQKTNQLDVHKKSGQLVPYKKSSLGVEVKLDEETLRVWNLLTDERGHEENDEEKRMKWEQERFIYRKLAELFIQKMDIFQGNRKFSRWKGSVIDSVVGAFLTQNVSDHLSSSAFMSLAAKFPLKSISSEQINEEGLITHGEELSRNNMVFPEAKFDKEEGLTIHGEELSSNTIVLPEAKFDKEEGLTSQGKEMSRNNIVFPEVKFDKEGLTTHEEELSRNNIVFPEAKFDKKTEDTKVEELEAEKASESSKVDNRGTKTNSSFMERFPDSPGRIFGNKQSPVTKKSKNQEEKEKLMEEKRRYWDTLRKTHTKSPRHSDQMDSVDWEAVRSAKLSDVANAIASRGQHNIIAARIQQLLNKLMDSNGSVDLEWLRDAPPKAAKEYLLSINGLGLKSTECIRLLTLHHSAFPVDVNVGRIVVRLGWVPIQPLPEAMQIHNLEEFPDPNKVQQYLWPRLCTLDQKTLYELHYHLITFGKVFCTKRNPNCNACPMNNACKHHKSALARTKLRLPAPSVDQRLVVTPMDSTNANFFQNFSSLSNSESTFITDVYKSFVGENSNECEPIIEMPASPEPESRELVASETQSEEIYNGVCEDNKDIEDVEDFLTIDLSSQESFLKTSGFVYEVSEHDMNTSTALVALHGYAANIPRPKMKDVSRLKTERTAYELPDDFPLLREHALREPGDPSPYLLVEWTKDELETSFDSSRISSEMVSGTLLIPCRTAMRGYFPLNGTYFQVNEVFADYASMINPIGVPRNWLWRLKTPIVYFGTGTSAITRGLSSEKIKECFWKGYLCLRAIDIKTKAPRPISSILHRNTTVKVAKENKNVPVNE